MNERYGTRGGTTRRAMIASIAAGGAVVVAGCLSDDEAVPDPISVDDGQACDNCDMQIEMHLGPVGLAFYGDDVPPELPAERADDDGVAWFCSTRCTYSFTFDAEDEGYEPLVAYATDYSDVSYTVEEDDGVPVISAHLGADDFASLSTLTYVVNSDVEGAMGPSLIGFTEADDASAFADEYGGVVVEHDDVTREVLSALGM